MRKLKPCPRCGADDAALDYLFWQKTNGAMKKRYFCKCNGCGAVTRDLERISDAKQEWNAGKIVAEPE